MIDNALRRAGEQSIGDGNLIHRFIYAEHFHLRSYMARFDPGTGEERTYRFVTDRLGGIRLVIETESGTIARESTIVERQ